MKINRIAYMVMRRFYYIPSMMHDIVSAENSKNTHLKKDIIK